MRLGGTEILVLLLIVMLLFGTSRLPKLARSLREARHEFEQGADDVSSNGKPASAEKPTEKPTG